MIYGLLFKLLLQRIPPQTAHLLGSVSLRLVTATDGARAFLRRRTFGQDDCIRVDALGLSFPSPLGAAGGLDKNADWFDALGAVGFGFVEVGTVTPQRQEPNPGTTIRRLVADRALLNRMGFPNAGAEAAARRLGKASGATIVAANIGKARATSIDAAAEDYRAVARELAPFAGYMVMNVSSPNTPGLRDLQAVERLEPLIAAVQDELHAFGSRVPLLIKVSPDMEDADLDAVADLALRTGLAGIVAVNTTIDRARLTASAAEQAAGFEGGGVSGPPLRARSLEVLRRLHASAGDRLVLVSVGGIETPADAWQRILAGATLVQAYTGFVYGGPGWPRRINRELAKRVRQAGAASIQDLVGTG